MSRNSRQRDAVYSCLQNTHTHPTAEEIYENTRKIIPNISRATVYRNLAFLEQEGKAVRFQIGPGSDRFDGNPHPHCHCVCDECGGVTDIPPEESDLKNITEHTEKYTGYKIYSYTIIFHGICRGCAG